MTKPVTNAAIMAEVKALEEQITRDRLRADRQYRELRTRISEIAINTSQALADDWRIMEIWATVQSISKHNVKLADHVERLVHDKRMLWMMLGVKWIERHPGLVEGGREMIEAIFNGEEIARSLLQQPSVDHFQGSNGTFPYQSLASVTTGSISIGPGGTGLAAEGSTIPEPPTLLPADDPPLTAEERLSIKRYEEEVQRRNPS